MINRLQRRLGTKGTVLQWFNRYSSGIDFRRQNLPSVDVRGPLANVQYHYRSDIANVHMRIVRIERVG